MPQTGQSFVAFASETLLTCFHFLFDVKPPNTFVYKKFCNTRNIVLRAILPCRADIQVVQAGLGFCLAVGAHVVNAIKERWSFHSPSALA